MEILAKPSLTHLCRVCTMATGFASRLWQWFAWGIMQVNRVKVFFFYCRDAAEDRGTCSCLQTLWRLLQPLALGTAKALQCYCCFREIMATDRVAQFVTTWKKLVGLNKTRIWQLWGGTADVTKFPITPWLWKVSMSCCLQPAERAREKGIPEQNSFPEICLSLLSPDQSMSLPDAAVTSTCACTDDATGTCMGLTSHHWASVCATQGGEWESVSLDRAFPTSLAWVPNKVFILWYDRPPLAHSFFNLLWHLGLVYTGDLIQIVWGCEFREE